MDRLNNDKNQNFEFSHNDVMFNPEEGCKVLRVSLQTFFIFFWSLI